MVESSDQNDKMNRRITKITVYIILVIILMIPSSYARMSIDAEKAKNLNRRFATITADCLTDHRIGRIQLTVTNIGTFGNGFISGLDCLTGQSTLSCEYPRTSGIRYLFAGAFWIGAVVGRDTLVSVGADGWSYVREMYPDELGVGNLIYRSLIDPTSAAFDNAVSEEDIIAVYTDTLTAGVDPDSYTGRAHQPLHVKVLESSYAWSYSYAEDFVLFDYQVTNIGTNTLEKVYMGIYVDADAGFLATCDQNRCWFDDVCGYVNSVPETLITRHGNLCIYEDTVNIAWIADNDGDFDAAPPTQPTSGAMATRIVRTPAEKLDVSFNWWISSESPSYDFGPRERNHVGRLKEPFRDLGHGGMGTPEGDRNKYYFLRNQEFDYDQLYSGSIIVDDSLWIYPNQEMATTYSVGYDTRYLLSFGPFNIDPGETLPVSFACVGGENFHVYRENLNENIIGNYNPDRFYSNLNFKDLTTNARWASWIYDNPGVDTDGDGYYGKSILCIDTIVTDTGFVYDSQINYITGDGVPDFEGAKPPPAPDFWVLPEIGSFTIQFNGIRSELATDEFLARATNNQVQHDFEGYRVYLARDERETSYSIVAAYDREDFNKYIWIVDSINPSGGWRLLDVPFTLDSLKVLYTEAAGGNFDPLTFPRSSPFHYVDMELTFDSLFYFDAQEYNVSHFGIDTDIRKRFPEYSFPSNLDADLVDPDELTWRDNRPYFKYFEYEVTLDNLLPTVAYWINVTAFDFGSPISGLPALESSKMIGSRQAYAYASKETIDRNSLKVFVYPNPYRIDGVYLEGGFEGRDRKDIAKAPDRKRRINFANVPPQCTIRIYSLDGDLVREIRHDVDPVDPTATHAEWDLITRNTQLVVSGMYYWSVENNETGEVQIGKLVIIM